MTLPFSLRWAAIAVALALSLAGCHDSHAHEDHDDHGHDHEHDDHDDHGHDHDDHGHDHDEHDEHDDHGHDEHDDHGHDEHGHDDHGHDHHGDGEIHFPVKYQQKVDFERAEVTTRRLRPSVQVPASAQPTSNGHATVTSPFDGEVSAPDGGIPEVGQTVGRGEVVGYVTPRIDPGEFSRIDSDLQAARAAVDRAERQVQRLEPLVESGAMAQRHLDDAESDLTVARAELRRARQRREQADTTERRGTSGRVAIRSPIDGVVTARSGVDGGFTTTGAALVEVIDRRAIWIQARIPEANLTSITDPQGLWFATDSAEIIDLQIGDDGRLVSFGDIIDPATRTTTMTVEMQDPPPNLRVGASFRAHIYGEESEEVSAIPRTAVLEEEGLDVVFVATGDDSFERRVVELGITDGDYAQVRQGLDAGETVVARGAYYVRLAAAATGEIGHGHHH